MVSATEKGGGRLNVLQVRFGAGLSLAMVCVGMSCLTDDARRALVALDYPFLKGGGLSYVQSMKKKYNI